MSLALPSPKFAASSPRWVLGLALLMFLPSFARCSSITGRVINRSRNQPSAGDKVVLYKVDRSMHEVARTRSREDGTFQFDFADFPYLVAVFHQNISYHTTTLREAEAVEIAVYDAMTRPGGARPDSTTLFVERASGAIKITEFFRFPNQTLPPRTVIGAETFRFALSQGAVLDSAAVQPPGTLPVTIQAQVCGPANSYCVGYPIRPGVNWLRVVFHLTQSDAAWITVQQPVGIRSVVVMVPRSLRVESRVPGALKAQGIESGQAKYRVPETRTARPLHFRLTTNFAEQFESRTSSYETPGKKTAPIAADLSRFIAFSSPWRAEHSPPETALAGRRTLLLGALAVLAAMGTFAAFTISSRRARSRSAA